MPNLLDSGIQLILFLQGLGAWLTAPMKLFSFLGNEQFFLLVMPVLYWSIDAAAGLRVGTVLLVGNGLNCVLKMVFQAPRPYFYDPRVKALTSETTFGIPSGHAQNSAGVWGMLAAQIGRRWAWAAAVVLVFLIGLSRMYLGVHFPTDVLFGWTAGAALVWGYLRLEGPLLVRLKRQSPGRQALAAFGGSLLLALLGVLARASMGAWTIPALWIQNTALALPQGPAPDPLALAGLFTSSGALFGLLAGAILLAQHGGFDARGEVWKRALRYPIGLVGVVVFWYGLDLLFPGGESALALALRYIRYALVGFWMSALAPLFFIRAGLAKRKSGGETPTSAASQGVLVTWASMNPKGPPGSVDRL